MFVDFCDFLYAYTFFVALEAIADELEDPVWYSTQ
jgi:predicted membrane chloride channel (bestrophin family)